MEDKITDAELLIFRYQFLKKNWQKFFFGGLVWLIIFILRDLFFGKRILWLPCLIFYGVNFLRWSIHYSLTRNYSKDEYPRVVNIYIWRYPIIKWIMFFISACIGCVYLITGKCEGIVFYTVLLCSGLDEFFEYLELKRFYKI